MHWSDKYVGLLYVAKTGDCAALAARVASEVLRIECGLPAVHAVTLREQSAQVMAYKDELAEKVSTPIDGHPALFLARGRLAHISVVCLIDAQVWILHADQSAGAVVRERVSRMTEYRYILDGYYRWL